MTHSVYLDTNVFISAYEGTDARSDHLLSLFAAIARREFHATTSEMTLAELLPKPLSLGQASLASFYVDLLSQSGPLKVAPVTREVLLEAASLRGKTPTLKLPDAVHIATALQRECTALLSDDRRLPLPPGMRMVRLSPRSLEDLRRMADD